MKLSSTIAGGLAGACTLTLIHETVRRFYPDAPRMDVLGMRAIAKGMRQAGETPPADETLHKWALAGDVLSNAVYYSLAGSGKHAWLRGASLGLVAGLGAVYLPGPLGLGEAPSRRTMQTQALTVAFYTIGGLVAAATSRALERNQACSTC